jgi:alpha-1,6-mannosyltransferase
VKSRQVAHWNPGREGLAPLLALGALGLTMVAFVAAGPWIIAKFNYAVFIPGIVASGALTVAATMLAPSVPARAGLLVIIGLAVIMRLLVIRDAPFLSTDIYRYIWDGRVQAAGINPYALVPADPTLAALRDAVIYPNINRADYAVTAYPPVAQIFFLAVTRISETLVMMRLTMVACEAVVVAVLIDLLRQLRLPATAVVAWAWHPLAIWEIAQGGHVDALMLALLMLGIWLLVRHRAIAGAVLVTLAALAKPYAIVALPSFWRPWDWRVPAGVLATIVLCYLPYVGVGRGVLGFVTPGGYLGEEGFADGSGFWLVALIRTMLGNVPGLTMTYLLAAAGTMVWLGVRAAWRTDVTTEKTLQDMAVLLMAGMFVLSPNYPWYFLAVVPFVALGGGAPAWAMTLAAPLLYRPIFLPDNDLVWKTLATLPFVIAAASTLLLRGRPSAQSQGVSRWTS